MSPRARCNVEELREAINALTAVRHLEMSLLTSSQFSEILIRSPGDFDRNQMQLGPSNDIVRHPKIPAKPQDARRLAWLTVIPHLLRLIRSEGRKKVDSR